MKKFILCLALTFGAAGCATTGITSAQALAISTPIVTDAMTLVLRNNPSYIPLVHQVGTDLVSADYTDLTIVGINTTIAVIGKKRNLDVDTVAIVTAAFDAGLAGYLGAVEEASLAKDPNAQAVLKSIGAAFQAATTSTPSS